METHLSITMLRIYVPFPFIDLIGLSAYRLTRSSLARRALLHSLSHRRHTRISPTRQTRDSRSGIFAKFLFVPTVCRLA